MGIVSTAAQASALSSGNVFVRSAAVFVMSMLPFIENKGAILLAAALRLKWYVSYLLTCIGMVMMSYILQSLSVCPLLRHMRGGGSVEMALNLGAVSMCW